MIDSRPAKYDVVIAGGGAGGVGAAIGAARAGAKVCLVEKYGFLGGAATTSQVLSYCGLYQQGPKPVHAVRGMSAALLDELKGLGLDCEAHCSETTGNWITLLDPEALKLALDRLVIGHGVETKLHTRVSAVRRTGQWLESVTLAGMGGVSEVAGGAFVDASGDANLAMLTGVDYRVGDGERNLQALTLPVRIGGVDPELSIDRRALIEAINEYNRFGRFPIKRDDGGIIVRLPVSGDIWWMIIDLDIQDLSSESFTEAERVGREMAAEYVGMLRTGVSGFERAHLVCTGPQVGVRETRHPEARYEISTDDALEGRQRADAVARAAWPMEVHGEAGKPVYRPVGGDGYFHVPYDSIRAKSVENLWYAGRVIGADPGAYGSVRVMGTAFATGEAAGVSAADYIDKNRYVDIESVQSRLIKQGALI